MKVKCIENPCYNINFTLGEIYEVKDNRITCNFVFLNLNEDVNDNDIFEFAMCTFKRLSLWEEELNKICQCPQRQDSLDGQIRDLYIIANKFGLYDAADYIKQIIK